MPGHTPKSNGNAEIGEGTLDARRSHDAVDEFTVRALEPGSLARKLAQDLLSQCSHRLQSYPLAMGPELLHPNHECPCFYQTRLFVHLLPTNCQVKELLPLSKLPYFTGIEDKNRVIRAYVPSSRHLRLLR